MPSLAESLGPWMLTGWPSKMIARVSIVWMPAIDLMSVDLPAPLSPTRAITWPSATWKSTLYRACTAPKLFDTPRSSRIGSLLLTFSLFRSRLCDQVVAPPPGGATGWSRHDTPASVQSCANLPVQASHFLRTPLSHTTLTLSFVSACGLSRTDGT